MGDGRGGAGAGAPRAPGADEMFVIGGGGLYREALPFADRPFLTPLDDDKEGDAFFPPYEQDFMVIVEENGTGVPPHRFLTLERK